MPEVFLYTMGIVTGLGVLALLCVVFAWPEWFQTHYSDGWAKSVVELIQLIAGVATIFVTISATEDKPRWFPTLVVSFCCVAIWRITQYFADEKSKRTERIRTQRLSIIEQLALQRAKLLSCLQHLLRIRVDRIESAWRPTGEVRPRSSITSVRPAIDPETQINDILEALVGYFQSLRPDTEETHKADVRVGLFIAQQGQAVPIHWFSLKARSREIYRSFREHPENFRLANAERTAHVVRCFLERQMFVIDDCVQAAQDGRFHFLNEAQRVYLRSLFVCPIGDLPIVTDGNRVELTPAMVVADSDLPNYFQEASESIYREAVLSFETRLLLEFNLLVLLNSGGKS